MINRILVAGAATMLALGAPAMAQMATQTTGTASSMDVGVSPMTGVSATDYVKMAAASDKFEIDSARVALMKSSRADVKSYAKMMISAHTGTSKTLMAALSNADRKIARPSTMLPTDKAANLKLLKSTPKASFDNIYLTQQVEAHQQAWSLNKGYALDGTDASLKQVAATTVPTVEQHLAQAKALMPAGMSSGS